MGNQWRSQHCERKTVTMTDVSNLHYDEPLGSAGMINNYKIASWFEDNR